VKKIRDGALIRLTVDVRVCGSDSHCHRCRDVIVRNLLGFISEPAGMAIAAQAKAMQLARGRMHVGSRCSSAANETAAVLVEVVCWNMDPSKALSLMHWCCSCWLASWTACLQRAADTPLSCDQVEAPRHL
jgi:hypothetical protein